MYAIIMYDVKAEKTQKICSYLRKWLEWKQNSVFEGQLTKSEMSEIKKWINEFIDDKNEQILIYTTLDESQIEKTVIGEEDESNRFL